MLFRGFFGPIWRIDDLPPTRRQGEGLAILVSEEGLRYSGMESKKQRNFFPLLFILVTLSA